LIKRGRLGFRLSNAIYMEIIPREIAFVPQLNFESNYDPLWYIKDNGFLDMQLLLKAFQDFFRQHSEHWLERFQYKEAGPQLLMQAFLQRIVNGGGRVEREYGYGRKRFDLFVLWKNKNDVQKVVIELKIRYGDLEKTITKGLEQTFKYMDKCGTDQGHLVIFDRRKKKTWEEKVFTRQEVFQGKRIMVWGM
ncbi:hypothetical protein QUF70_18160, partial [Desulfobacterales bacterium HSG17]|nr:hypothetical protein [Desulfobacterales bacterium HSG17]